MVDESGEGDNGSSVSSGITSHRSDSPRETKPVADTVEGVDIISSMPHEILHHILSFIPTRDAIRTSVLSRGWRHISSIFYRSSSLETLSVDYDMIPGCTVSWKSLRKLKLGNCNLYGKIIDNILSGSPILETLELFHCRGPQRLDLNKSRSLRRLEIYDYDGEPTEIDDYDEHYQGPNEIVAPHIQYLSLCSSYGPFTLVDVSCLAEASIHIYLDAYELPFNLKAEIFQTAVLEMLAKLQNAERLSFDGTLLQILSLAQLRGVSFPTFKVQTLTLKTTLARSVIPGITMLLHNSPGLKKLIVEASQLGDIEDRDIYSYLESQGLDPDQSWYSYKFFPTSDEFYAIVKDKESTWEVVVLFVEMMLINVTTLETLVVGLEYIGRCFNNAKLHEEVLRMLPTLVNNNNVSIVLKR
ncbi:hypothetical protein Bca52824_069500 [Brassica carinata]|uniref:F-box domain-containing protein n=1 Tax=Brassica carinata TaxID=52824 RepID=A0A8X7Q2E5_BRACI|nr:hypothetical protein Bca52824_069500 [Brassica carinata]